MMLATNFTKFPKGSSTRQVLIPVVSLYAINTCPFFCQMPALRRRLSAMSISSNSSTRQHLFSYTSGRCIYNEGIRLAERHVVFNVRALEDIAAKSVAREKVVCTKKIAEGGFNRVFLLTMDDGFEVIVKIPYSVTGPKTYATESEVATLDFLRSNGVPVPQVYSYSSQSDNAAAANTLLWRKLMDSHWIVAGSTLPRRNEFVW